MYRSVGLKLLLGLVGLLILLVIGLGAYLSLGRVLSERHYPFEYSEEFDFNKSSFEEYIVFSQAHLQAGRVEPPSATFIKNASPFMLEPGPECARLENGKYENGIVITHGLIASPYSMKPIADYFQSRCFYVIAPLLPDHATRPGDFIDTSWEEWAQIQAFALDAVADKAENIFLSGHSAGGTLAIFEGAINPEVDGLILFTPALQITSAAKYAKHIRWLSYIFPKAAWFEIREDEADYRFESVTMSAAEQTYELIQASYKVLGESLRSIPVFSVASAEDNTVSTDATLSYMANQTHPASRTLLYSQNPVESSEKVKVLNSYSPDQGILSVSHLGIMTPASHAEYGVDGNYRNCGHYYGQDNNLHTQCKAGQRDFYGEVTAENLTQGLIERIAFNPFYDELLLELDSFLDSF